MKMHHITCIFFLILTFMNSSASQGATVPKITYTVTFPEAQAHYVDVEMNISGLQQNILDLKMPVWTPGSYLVREFAKNVEAFSAESNSKVLLSKKTRKNIWRITTGGASSVKIKYRVYAFELSVRTSLVDNTHAFLSTSGIFMYPDGMLHYPSTIHIIPYKSWTKISTSLEMVNNDPFILHSPDYDILYDSPIEVGNQDVFGFDQDGVKYEIVMCGGGNYDKNRLLKDVLLLVKEETAIYGENPNKRYVFIVHNTSDGGGGLEHLSSTVLGGKREKYNDEKCYREFLGLAAHEHFHLWNVKRLRPIALGPFDYDNENYTTDLWIAEGLTAYYEDIIVQRTRLYSTDEYLGTLTENINYVSNQPGNKVQSLSQASFDAWIKYYRPDANSVNTSISYYDKGAVIGFMLDVEIINDSKAKYSLDDVIKYMYDTYYKLKKRGYTDEEFKQGLEKFAGKNLDDFYNKYIYGTADIDYNRYLGYAGYQAVDDLALNEDPSLGITTKTTGGKITIATVLRDGAGWKDGLSVNDEITAIDGTVITDATKMLDDKKPGDKITVSVNRDGLPLQISVTLLKSTKIKYHIESLPDPTAQQLIVRKKWLKL